MPDKPKSVAEELAENWQSCGCSCGCDTAAAVDEAIELCANQPLDCEPEHESERGTAAHLRTCIRALKSK